MKKKKRKVKRKKTSHEPSEVSRHQKAPKLSQAERMQLAEELLIRTRIVAMTSEEHFDREIWMEWAKEEMKRLTGYVPYGWQLVVGEALMLGLDVLLLAGTGSGKTNTFLFPLLKSLRRREKMMIWIFSPLKELQSEQVCLSESSNSVTRTERL